VPVDVPLLSPSPSDTPAHQPPPLATSEAITAGDKPGEVVPEPESRAARLEQFKRNYQRLVEAKKLRDATGGAIENGRPIAAIAPTQVTGSRT
jgi:hypothetical protein